MFFCPAVNLLSMQSPAGDTTEDLIETIHCFLGFCPLSASKNLHTSAIRGRLNQGLIVGQESIKSGLIVGQDRV